HSHTDPDLTPRLHPVPTRRSSELARGYRGMVKRVPVGVCSFITPFNFPLSLVAHKVAPAIAAGCPFVLKPAVKTPVGALIIGEVDRKSTRLHSSHVKTSYAVFCLQ